MSDNSDLNESIKHCVSPGIKLCLGCDGKGWQKRSDGIKLTCPMCGGTGISAPTGQPVWDIPSYISV